MEQSGLPYTPFDTDNTDRNNAVWNKVFGNLQDFGVAFAQGRHNPNTAPTPNPYGPILLIFNPEVFQETTDVAICLRSAGGRNFDREHEALSIEFVNGIFEYEDINHVPNNYAKAYIKYASQLQQRFSDPNAQTPEVSCVVQSERLTFKHLSSIIVDPYVINNKNLKNSVDKIKKEYQLPGTIWARRYKEGRMEIKQELANILVEELVSITEIIDNPNNSENILDWARRIQNGNVTFFYNRFARYLRAGTLLELNFG